MQDPQLLNINAKTSQVHQLLGEIQISIDEMEAQANSYNSFEKKFKVLIFLSQNFKLIPAKKTKKTVHAGDLGFKVEKCHPHMPIPCVL